MINERMPRGGLFTGAKEQIHPKSNAPWRIPPEPFRISQDELRWFERIGDHLLKFYKACNILYSQSVRGILPKWISEYLDIGKPPSLIEYSRIRRFKSHIPLVIRPDVIPTNDGMVITELDSVPGGIGFTANMMMIYSDLGYEIIGGVDGMIRGFERMIRKYAKVENPSLAILVSEESSDYWDEMMWLSRMLNKSGLKAFTLRPEEISFNENGIWIGSCCSRVKIDVIYRFFELFDLRNVPNSEIMMYMNRIGKVRITPPFKHFLEEKMLMAMLDHPELRRFWIRYLGRDSLKELLEAFPKTWIVDPTPLPPYGVIPDLSVGGLPVTSWDKLKEASQRERELILKLSGFSEMAWGARSVLVGHDVPAEEWRKAIERALASFPENPYILQRYHKGKLFRMRYYDFDRDEILLMEGRVRLCPYYFVWEDKAHLCGILATICPADKKVLHGMRDAIMAPCAVR